MEYKKEVVFENKILKDIPTEVLELALKIDKERNKKD